MAVYFKTKTPKKLLSTFKRAIDGGKVTTWSYDKDGDFTHTPEQWKNRAWLRPRVKERERLELYILGAKDRSLTSAIYAIYHGRFVESMLRHCEDLFEEGVATAMPTEDDVV